MTRTTPPYSQLAKQLNGDISTNPIAKMLYASDASLYQQTPLAIARPKDVHDYRTIVQFANEHNIPLIARGGGTSLGGQVVGPALIIDVSRYMNKVLAIDVDKQLAHVQPGVIPAQLNAQLAATGLMYAPDPSTENRCTIGGMIGNNSWGVHCPQFGTTREHTLSLNGILANGDALVFDDKSAQHLSEYKKSNTLEGTLYQRVIDELIASKEPLTHRQQMLGNVPCNTGYALTAMLDMQPISEPGSPFNLTPLLCGSEGTLALISEATVRLVQRPKNRLAVCSHFLHLDDALNAVTHIQQFKPAAIELLDKHLINLIAGNLEQRRNSDWISGEPKALLIIEFNDNPNEETAIDSMSAANALIDTLKQEKLGYYHPILPADQIHKAWAIRKSALGLLMGLKQARKAVTFIEDSAVPLHALPTFVSQVEKIIKKHQTDCVYYGSVSMGLLHLRPFLDLKSPSDIEKLNTISTEISALIVEHGGCMSAKHGDGRVRSSFIKAQTSSALYDSFCRIKLSFDPMNLLNPGKIFGAAPLTSHLRQQSPIDDSLQPHTHSYTWPLNRLLETVEQCNGAAVCRRISGTGTMCPSYRASQEEYDSVRGRANVYRTVLQQYGESDGIVREELHRVLDNCLSCKGCKSECPANVDMARLKSEHLQHWIDKNGMSLSTRAIKHFDRLSQYASYFPTLANQLLRSAGVKALLGYHRRRSLPKVAHPTLGRWFKRHHSPPKTDTRNSVVLLNDVFTQYYDVSVGIAAVQLLEHMGYSVTSSPCFPALRTVISQGLLKEAKIRLTHTTDWLFYYANQGIKIIGLEPSELLTFRDEAIDLSDTPNQRNKIKILAQHTLLLEEFVVMMGCRLDADSAAPPARTKKISIHSHCHQKSLLGIEAGVKALSLIPDARITPIESGCCGLAGAFGYATDKYSLSMQIGELSLLPSIRSLDDGTTIAANGTSCRHQIMDGTGKKALHPAEILRDAFVLTK